MKLCKDCKFLDSENFNGVCIFMAKISIDPVMGIKEYEQTNVCRKARQYDGFCGPKGKFFIPKNPLIYKIKNFFKGK